MKTILCFGDSNTHGTMPMASLVDSRRFPLEARWPTLMAKELGPDYHIIAEGHPGRTTVHPDPIEGEHKSAMGVLLALLESHAPLDLVLIMLGTNDLKARFSVSAFEIAEGTARLASIVATSS